jgi:hypothetical protein
MEGYKGKGEGQRAHVTVFTRQLPVRTYNPGQDPGGPAALVGQSDGWRR